MNWAAIADSRRSRARPMDDLRPAATLTITELHERHLSDVYAYVSRRIAVRPDAEDITAEVFADAFRALVKFRGDCDPKLWLFGIARRKIADHLRRYPKRAAAALSEVESRLSASVDGDPVSRLERKETSSAIRTVVDQLKGDQHDVLLMRYVEDLSIAEIAVIIGRSPAAVNSLLQRARESVARLGKGYFHGQEEVI